MPHFLQLSFLLSLLSYQIYAFSNSIGAIGINGRFTATGSYTVDVSSTYNNATAPDYLYFNVTLPISQPNNLYILGVSLSRLQYNYVDNMAYLFVQIDTKTTTDFRVRLYSMHTQYMPSIGFRYLMITSSWTVFKSQYCYWQPNVRDISGVLINTTMTTATHGVSVVNMTGVVGFYYCITGFDYRTTNSNQDIGNYLTVYRQSATSLWMKLQRSYGFNYYCMSIAFFSLSFNVGELSSVGVLRGTQFVGFYDKLDNIALSSVNYNSLFYGVVAIHAPRGVSLSIILTHTTSTVTIASGWASNLFRVNYLKLTVATADGCCQTTPYFHSADNLCYDLCPDGFYQNSIDFKCSPCDNKCLTCSNITSCITCKLSNTTCIICSGTVSNCALCLTITTCSACNSFYDLQPNGTCLINCSSISSCVTCTYSNQLNCSTCISGYYSNVTHCTSQCGDGVYVSNEGCQDNNTADNDGCSSACIFETGFYCNISASNISNCASCSSSIGNCLTCFNASYCYNCSIFYDLYGNGTLCQINCSTISLCINCAVNGSNLSCNNCQIGYYSNLTHCNSQCGDGNITIDQNCDDGNILNNDGCSINCTFEPRFQCTIVALTTVCIPCPSNCLWCENGSYCTQCQSFTYILTQFTTSYCYNFCPFGYFGNSTQMKCILCPYNCRVCSNQTTCQICIIGMAVLGGCSQVEGCTAIVQNITSMKSICTNCSHPMTLWNQTCICPVGQWLVTRLCTSVAGCIATAVQNNIVVCKACNIQKMLSLINGKCQCANGFILNQSFLCQEVCGDGKIFFQECDDGNKMDGDGCSSTCLIEKNYICKNGSKTKATDCAYFGRNFKILLLSVDKIDYENKGIFIFKISPALYNFQKINFINNLIFQSSRTTSIVGWSYDRGEIQLEIEYSESLQEFEANLTLVFNQSIIIQQPVSINFIMASKGVKLVIVKNYSTIKLMEYILLGFSSFIFLLFVFGSLFHKMIGMETLHAFQLLYFIHSLDKSYTSPYSMFRFLTYLNCNFLYFFNKEMSIPHPNNSFTYNNINRQFSNLIIVGLSFMVLVLSIILKIKSIKKQQEHQNKRTSQKLSVYIYNHLAFPLFIGFFWAMTMNYFNVRDNQNNSLFESIPIMFNAIISLIFLIVLGCIFWFQWKGILTNQRNKQSYFGLTKCNLNHIPIYLSYVLLINLCFVVQYLELLTFSKEIIMVLTLLLLIKYCYNKPYKSGIHNAGLIFNLLMVLIFIIWTLVRNISQSAVEEDKQILIIGVFFLLMSISIIIWTVRIIYEVRYCCSTEFKKKEKEANHKNFIQNDRNIIKQKLNEERVKEQLNKLNKYCLKVMKQKDDFDDWNQLNKQRLLSDMMGVYGSNDVDKKMQGMQKVFKKRVQKEINAQKALKSIKQRLKKSFMQKQIGLNRKLNNDDNEY